MKYNLKEVIEKLEKAKEQKETVEIWVTANNGRKKVYANGEVVGVGDIVFENYYCNGIIEEIEQDPENLAQSRITIQNANIPLLSIGGKNCYQCGVSKIKTAEGIIYQNPFISFCQDLFVYSADKVFDDESVFHIYKNWKENPYSHFSK